jgi:hypothetical protein
MYPNPPITMAICPLLYKTSKYFKEQYDTTPGK